MIRFRILAAAALVIACSAAPAQARLHLEQWRGHISVGYAKVFSDSLAPGGSLSAGVGVDYPIASTWRLGPAISYSLLGSATVDRGSFVAAIDYSVVEGALLLTWTPPRGPFGRISFGPGLASARADLSVSAGGASFSDLAVNEVRPEFAFDATLMPRHLGVVGVGAELGTRVIPVTQGTWTVFTARLAVHY